MSNYFFKSNLHFPFIESVILQLTEEEEGMCVYTPSHKLERTGEIQKRQK